MSIRVRLAVFLLMAFLVMAVLALYVGNVQNDKQIQLQEIYRTSSELINQTEELESHFQKQLLSWSSLLLRGQDPEEYHNYLSSFYEQERNTREHIGNLEKLLGAYNKDGTKIQEFRSSHDELGLRFRNALKIFNQSDDPVYETDRYIWGAVDNPSRLLTELKINLLERKKEQLFEAEKEYFNNQRVIVTAAILIGIVIFLVFLWFIDRNLGRPLSKAIKVAGAISYGDFEQRVSKDLPGEFNMFARAFNKMIDRLTQANDELNKRMEELKEEILAREELELELDQKKKIAEEASIAKSEFLSTMSHEIRTPLNVVTGFADLLSSTDATEKQLKYIKSIQSGSESLLSIVNDVLDFSKIESGKISLELHKFNIRDLLMEIKQMISQSAMVKTLEFDVEVADDVPEYIIADENKIKQILLNLLSNAVKFTEIGSVSLGLELLQKSGVERVDLCFSVVDTGIGIPEEFQDKIFHQFEQQDGQDSRRYGGTGLGLAISMRLAQILNGLLTVSSVHGSGSRFSLNLYEVEVSEFSEVSIDKAQDEKPKLRKSKLLIADDIEANRNLLISFLHDQDVEIVEAENGKTAIDMAQRHMPDIILMDIKMPIMDGIEATRKIKSDEKLKNIPIIALTASSIAGDDAQSKEELFDFYLTKPVKLIMLLNTLVRYLN